MQSQCGQEHYYANAAGYTPIRVNYVLHRILSYSDVVSDAESLMPAIEARLVGVKPGDIDGTALDRLKQALKLTRRLRPEGCKVEIVAKRHPGDNMRAGGLAIHASNKVLLLESWVEDATVNQLTETLVEEFMHLKSGASDISESFQRALVAQIAVMLMPRVRVSEVSL